MAKGNYTLRNQDYFDLLGRVTEGLDEEGIEYALVGGAGVQARICDIIGRARQVPIRSADELDLLLRPTGDYDITAKSTEQDFVKFFNALQAKNAPHILVEQKGKRSARIVFDGTEKIAVTANYQTGPQDFMGLDDEFYEEVIQTADMLNLAYNSHRISARVAQSEALVTSKLTRSTVKDVVDIVSLLRAINTYGGQSLDTFDEEKVRSTLERAGKGEMFSELERINAQVFKE